MAIPVVKFNNKDNPEFSKTLRKRVNSYFKDNNISKYANWNMKFKTVFMICLYFVPMILMNTGIISSTGGVFALWILMGLGMSGIGLSVMHDANHGSYSKNKKVNHYLGSLIHFISGSRENWKIQHNVLHHSFTNIEGLDEDIETAVMRLAPNQDRKSIHKYQAYYAPFAYGIMTMYWAISKDFEGIKKYKEKGLLERQGLDYKKLKRQLIINKTWYFALTLVLPLLVVNLPWYTIVGGFVAMHFISGLILALIFQTAHSIEETEHFIADQGSMENSRMIHQLKTTANFANDNPIFTWLVGGLNHQIEHHLFPNICHIHYPKIAKIVESTAKEFGIPYHNHHTWGQALYSHFSLLNQLGTGKYDKKLAIS